MNNEFNVKKYKDATVYTLESATGGGTSAGSIASVSMPLGGVQKRASLVTSEANKDKPTQTNPVAKAAQRVAKGSGTHKNPKKVLPRKEKHRKPMAEGISELGYDAQSLITKLRRDVEEKRLKPTPDAILAAADELAGDMKFAPQLLVQQVLGKGVVEDHEIQMASSELQSIAKNAVNLLSLVRKYSEQDGLEAWQQSKITKAADYLNSVLQSVSGEQSGMESDLDERNIGQPREVAHKPVILSAEDDGKTITVKVRVPDGTTRTIANSNPAIIQQWLNVKYGLKLPPNIAKKFVGMPMSMAESVEDRTSYQVAKILIAKGIKYDSAKEGQLITAIGDVMINELGMDKKIVRNIIYRDDDFLADTLSELHHMSKDVEEGRHDNRDAYQRDYDFSQTGFSRPHDHRDLGQELAHERNNYAVAIDGKTWKVFADKSQAQNIARSLQAKGKNATVHPTGENPSEGVAEGEKTMSRAAKGNEKYGKDGMKALAKAGREGASEKKLDAIRDKHDNYNEEAKHGLYYNVNKRKAAGTSRPASSPKAPTAQAWKDAAKTAKKEDIGVGEEWSKKYKSSINCSHPKGFSQKAHCAGKKKHNEDMSMEAVCPDCGMCQTHGNVMEIKKGAKDSNGVSSCWSGYHAAGTKKGKNGGTVRNCVPNESVAEDAYMESLADRLAEKLNPHAEPEVWVQDFQKANPNKYHQFKNKTPQKKAQMAVAARYAALEPSKKK